jgi:hopanoid biosynthesis associated RND transporter like protein HpnN
LIHTLDETLGRATLGWVERVQRRPGRVVWAFLAVSAAAIAAAATTLGLDSDENAMFSDDLPFVQQRRDFNRAFPSLVDPIVVVVDGATVDLASDAATALVHRLEGDPSRFASVYQPGGGAFFERNGLLYLSVDELEELVDNLFAMQPYLAELSRDASLRGFLSLLTEAVDAVERGELEGLNLADVLDRVTAAVEARLEGRMRRLSWADVILGRESTPSDRRRFLLVEPRVDFEHLQPAERTLDGLEQVVRELGYDDPDSGVLVRTTGVFPLAHEEMEQVSSQATWAGVASFCLVTVVLLSGLGSVRMVLASLATLLVGLAWTAGFAALAVGHLNLVSVAFGVLFIGLSIDFAIHICVRLRGRVAGGEGLPAALRGAAGDVGGSLVLCATTTAIGFYAFIPTDYAGVAELGLIAGTGMFISLLANLTLLPALLTLAKPSVRSEPGARALARLAPALDLPVRHARAVIALTALLALGAALLLPRVRFDANPLRVRDPSTQSVQVFDEMLAEGTAFPWNLNALATDLAAADRIAERLEALPAVDMTLTLSDYVPEDQEEKLALLEDAAFVLLPTLRAIDPPPPPGAEQRAAIRGLEQALRSLAASGAAPALAPTAERLADALGRLQAVLSGSPADAETLGALETALLGSLPDRLRMLRRSLEAERVTLSDLPDSLVERMIATDGRARVEIFPEGDLGDDAALAAYVEQVRSVAPGAFGEGLVILESGRAVVRALRQALATAAVLIAVLLLLLWRNVGDASLVALPLALAALFTTACSVLGGVPFNFANVIVIPLLLGMGVDTGIHLVHRMRTRELPGGNLLRTSTARAVLLSALTTIASFGTLGLSTHRGMASLGQLLAIGLALILLANLVVLPALARLSGRAAPPE